MKAPGWYDVTDPPVCGEVRVLVDREGSQAYRLVEFRCRGCGDPHRRVYYPPYPEGYSEECGECWDRGRRERIESGRNA